MTKKEMIDFLAPFDDEIEIFLKDYDQVMLPTLRYEMEGGVGYVYIIGDE